MLVNKSLDTLVVVLHSFDSKMADTLVHIDWSILDYIEQVLLSALLRDG